MLAYQSLKQNLLKIKVLKELASTKGWGSIKAEEDNSISSAYLNNNYTYATNV